jgi:signal peptidase
MLKKNKAFKVVTTIGKVFLTIFVVIIVGIIFVQRFSNNKVTLLGYSIFTVVSESMAPEYNIGDMIIAKKVNEDSIMVNDDVVYLGEKGSFADKIVTHRVIKIDDSAEKVFHTKGIANNEEDPSIGYDQILGVVICKSVILSFLSHVVNNQFFFYFAVFVPFCIMIFLEIIEVAKEKKSLEKGE